MISSLGRTISYLREKGDTQKNEKVVNIGVLGASQIAEYALIKPVGKNPGFKVAAIAASTKAKAEKYAKTHNIPKSFGDYKELIRDEEIDVVYISLRTQNHFEYAEYCLNHGKHIFCEKPISFIPEESEKLEKLAEEKDLILFEAYHYRFHPAFLDFEALVLEHAKEVKEIKIEALVISVGDYMSCCSNAGKAKTSDHTTMYNLFCYCVDILLTLFPGIVFGKDLDRVGEKLEISLKGGATWKGKSIKVDLVASRLKSVMSNNISLKLDSGAKLEYTNFSTPMLYHKIRNGKRAHTKYSKGSIESTFDYQLRYFEKVLQRSPEHPTLNDSTKNAIFFHDNMH